MGLLSRWQSGSTVVVCGSKSQPAVIQIAPVVKVMAIFPKNQSRATRWFAFIFSPRSVCKSVKWQLLFFLLLVRLKAIQSCYLPPCKNSQNYTLSGNTNALAFHLYISCYITTSSQLLYSIVKFNIKILVLKHVWHSR